MSRPSCPRMPAELLASSGTSGTESSRQAALSRAHALLIRSRDGFIHRVVNFLELHARPRIPTSAINE